MKSDPPLRLSTQPDAHRSAVAQGAKCIQRSSPCKTEAGVTGIGRSGNVLGDCTRADTPSIHAPSARTGYNLSSIHETLREI